MRRPTADRRIRRPRKLRVKLRPVAYAVAILTVALHLAFNHRFGYYRDELYFIDCARHLAWGYVDQPPLAPFVAWLAAPFGYAVWALRFLPAILSGVTVLLACAIARELRGGAFAQAIAAVTVFAAPGLLGLGYGLSTEMLSPAAWSALNLLDRPTGEDARRSPVRADGARGGGGHVRQVFGCRMCDRACRGAGADRSRKAVALALASDWDRHRARGDPAKPALASSARLTDARSARRRPAQSARPRQRHCRRVVESCDQRRILADRAAGVSKSVLRDRLDRRFGGALSKQRRERLSLRSDRLRGAFRLDRGDGRPSLLHRRSVSGIVCGGWGGDRTVSHSKGGMAASRDADRGRPHGGGVRAARAARVSRCRPTCGTKSPSGSAVRGLQTASITSSIRCMQINSAGTR